MPKTIMALDPGVTTGISVMVQQNDNTPKTFFTSQIRPDKFPHPHESLFDTISGHNPDILIYEAFHYRQKDGAELQGVEFIGVAELYGQLNCIPIVKINPSDGKGFWVDKKLRALVLYKVGMPHGNDATRLMLTYLMKNDKPWFNEVIESFRDIL